MSFETGNFNNNDEPVGSQGMPGASDSPQVRVPEVKNSRSKVWVLVERRNFPIVYREWRPHPKDKAGRFVTQFCWADLNNTEEVPKEKFWLRNWDITSQFKSVNVHDCTKRRLIPLRVPISSSTGPFHKSIVLPYIEANEGSEFIGPAYPDEKNPKWINDTQLCVSGKVEDYDASLEDAAIREIREEIGTNFEIREIRQMAGPVEANGFTNYLFFACI